MSLIRQLVTFGAVGLCGTAVHYLTLGVLVETAGTGPVAATIAGYLLGAAVNYWLNATVTFKGASDHRDAVGRFAVSVALGFVVNASVVWLLTGPLQIHYLAAQIVATGLVFLLNFVLARYWVFVVRAGRP